MATVVDDSQDGTASMSSSLSDQTDAYVAVVDVEFSNIELKRQLIKRVLKALINEELTSFLDSGVLDNSPTFKVARKRLLAFPPFKEDNKNINNALDIIVKDLPCLIQAYNTATGEDLKKKIVGFLAGTLVFPFVPVIEENIILRQQDDQDQDHHRFYQRQFFNSFSLFLAGLENDGGIDGFVTKIQAFHSIKELPFIYKQCFDHVKEYIVHCLQEIVGDKVRIKKWKKIYNKIPQQPIITIAGFKTSSKVSFGMFNLLFIKPPLVNYNLFQRFLMSKLGYDEHEKNFQKAREGANPKLGHLVYMIVSLNYPIAWQRFCNKNAIQNELRTFLKKIRERTLSSGGSSTSLKTSCFDKERSNSLKPSVVMSTDSNSGEFRAPLSRKRSLHEKMRASFDKRIPEVTIEEIDSMTDEDGYHLWNLAYATICMYDQAEYINFVGSQAVTDMAELIFKSFSVPMQQLSIQGGMGDMVAVLFKNINELLPLLESTTIEEKERTKSIEGITKNIIAALYEFLHKAISLDSGELLDTIKWIFTFFTNATSALDFDEFLNDKTEEEKSAIWEEVREYLRYFRKKNREGAIAKPESQSNIDQLTSKLQGLIKDRLSTDMDKNYKLDSKSMETVHKLCTTFSNAAVTSRRTMSKNGTTVLTHMQISSNSSSTTALQLQGFRQIGEYCGSAILGKKSRVDAGFPPICDLILTNIEDVPLYTNVGFVLINTDLAAGSMITKKLLLMYKRGDEADEDGNLKCNPITNLTVQQGDGIEKAIMKGFKSLNRPVQEKGMFQKKIEILYKKLNDHKTEHLKYKIIQ